MIYKLIINKLKNIKCEEFVFKPLTILTGLNSTGKSSVLQSILLINKETTSKGVIYFSTIPSSFLSLRNIYERAKEINIQLETDAGNITYKLSEDGKIIEGVTGLRLEENLYYLSANRVGVEVFAEISQDVYCGIDGTYLFGTYEKEKSNPVCESLIMERSSFTLASQVNYWQSHILGIKLELSTEKRNEQTVEIKYKSDGIPDLLPTQLGTGVSYLVKILILCLRAKRGDVIMIENPEVHLHPAAQSRLGEFFVFIAKAGIQLILETHCEHLINKVQYEVFKKRFKADDTVIYYKKGIAEPFIEIPLKENGQFKIDFPEGFFDAALPELLEMDW
ncbi:hypothetical protein EZS27_026256 [termite gut metagenome]|uniref:Endonuclease GajA/Old nuclease/RecF-like AAA domain-containing protein n=1 Tax=termite gut metagenome TaxID=433724 RepID=A0A5J4QTL0_9ZZZZ